MNTDPAPCVFSPWSSRVCERGTKSCNVEHENKLMNKRMTNREIFHEAYFLGYTQGWNNADAAAHNWPTDPARKSTAFEKAWQESKAREEEGVDNN